MIKKTYLTIITSAISIASVIFSVVLFIRLQKNQKEMEENLKRAIRTTYLVESPVLSAVPAEPAVPAAPPVPTAPAVPAAPPVPTAPSKKPASPKSTLNSESQGLSTSSTLPAKQGDEQQNDPFCNELKTFVGGIDVTSDSIGAKFRGVLRHVKTDMVGKGVPDPKDNNAVTLTDDQLAGANDIEQVGNEVDDPTDNDAVTPTDDQSAVANDIKQDEQGVSDCHSTPVLSASESMGYYLQQDLLKLNDDNDQ